MYMYFALGCETFEMNRFLPLLSVLLISCSTADKEGRSTTVEREVESYSAIQFDYSAAELVLTHFSDTGRSSDEQIVSHPAYRHILAHSEKFSSNPITTEDLSNALQLNPGNFDLTGITSRTDSLRDILKFIEENEQRIMDTFANLPLTYLPGDYRPNATIYFVIGGYNGIAFDDKVCVNIDHAPFRNNYNELLLYISHELFHIGFEEYHPLPDVFAATTVRELKNIVMTMTMNEGLATLTPYQKRVDMHELSDYDYKTLLDSIALDEKMKQFNIIVQYLDENIDTVLTDEILGHVLGQCSGDRLFYIVGCNMGLKIEKEFGVERIKESVRSGDPQNFFDAYYESTEK